jgi:hypothetical protein
MGQNSFDIRTIYEDFIRHDEDFIRHDDESGRSSPTRSQKITGWLLGISGLLFGLSMVFLWLHHSHPHASGWATVGKISTLVAFLCWAGAYLVQLSKEIPVIARDARQPTRLLLNYASRDQGDYDFATRLSEHDDATLQFLARRLRSHAKAVRKRARLAFGPIDKTGIFPASLGVILAAAQIWPQMVEHKITIPPILLSSGGGLLWGMFVGAILTLPASHRLDELAQIVDLALETRQSQGSPN